MFLPCVDDTVQCKVANQVIYSIEVYRISWALFATLPLTQTGGALTEKRMKELNFKCDEMLTAHIHRIVVIDNKGGKWMHYVVVSVRSASSFYIFFWLKGNKFDKWGIWNAICVIWSVVRCEVWGVRYDIKYRKRGNIFAHMFSLNQKFFFSSSSFPLWCWFKSISLKHVYRARLAAPSRRKTCIHIVCINILTISRKWEQLICHWMPKLKSYIIQFYSSIHFDRVESIQSTGNIQKSFKNEYRKMNFILKWNEAQNFKYEKIWRKKNKNNIFESASKPSTPFT